MPFKQTMSRTWSSIQKAFGSFDVQAGSSIEPNSITSWQEWSGVSCFSLLFFCWGLAYGLLDVMNYHIKVAMSIDRASAALLALTYYSAYVPGSLCIGGPLVRKYGYRFAAVVGLLFLGIGDQIMSIGAARLQFSMMCFGHFVVGIGVSGLESTANPYTVNVGRRKGATFRILFGQSMAAFGTVIAPLLANAVIFDATKAEIAPLVDPKQPGRCLMPPPPSQSEAGNLHTVISFYRWLGCGIFALAFALAILFFRTKLVVEPVVSESPKLDQSAWKFWKHPLCSRRYTRVWYGVVANFFNLGCQVTVAQFFIEHMRVNACNSDKQAAQNMMWAQVLFMVGRLVAAALVMVPALPLVKNSRIMKGIFKGRIILACYLAGAVAFTGVGVGAKGQAAVAFACMIMFAESPSFPMIFETATTGLGQWTSTAESITITSICGGGILPVAMGKLVDRAGISTAWILPTICFTVVWSFPLNCNLVPSFKHGIDSAHGEEGDKQEVEMERAG
ncbi:hypothetical protein LTR05_001164 [Lithohypha guttulata]|uniref:MFS general substrate transporter n=1 Tax=Lithohypha guttulata TaxID=1690604 RepID=A0AAN7TE55_9EURO|nr:hypothetical protein LTR05_001164 [Lithohypha guttulata]